MASSWTIVVFLDIFRLRRLLTGWGNKIPETQVQDPSICGESATEVTKMSLLAYVFLSVCLSGKLPSCWDTLL
jgi:hypothetical protein